MNALDIEELLESYDVFINGMTGRPACLDSYMTVIDFDKLSEFFNDFLFDPPIVDKAITYWKSQAYLSPMFSLIASQFEKAYQPS